MSPARAGPDRNNSATIIENTFFIPMRILLVIVNPIVIERNLPEFLQLVAN